MSGKTPLAYLYDIGYSYPALRTTSRQAQETIFIIPAFTM